MMTTRAFRVPSIPSQPRLWLTNRIPVRRSHRSLHQRKELMMAIDVRAIYDIDGMDEQKLDDLRKGGLPLTKAMRNLRVEHDKDISKLDQEVQSVMKKIEDLEREKDYRKLALNFLLHYIATGRLAILICKDDDNLIGDTARIKNSTRLESYYEDGTFDPALCKRCFAKYGFDIVRHEHKRMPDRTLI